MNAAGVAAARAWFAALQQRVVAALEAVEGRPFLRDAWTRPEGGGGISRLIEDGNVWEKRGLGVLAVVLEKEAPGLEEECVEGLVRMVEAAVDSLAGIRPGDESPEPQLAPGSSLERLKR